MRNRVWMRVGAVLGMAIGSVAAHAAGAGRFACGQPDPVGFQVVSYDVSMSEANGKVMTTVNMRAPKANKQVLMKHLNQGSVWMHCTLGPAGGGGYALSQVLVTAVNDAQGAKKDMVDVKLSCTESALQGKKK